MNSRNIASLAASALVGSLLLIATTSAAQPGQPEVVIEKQAPMTRYVTFADLSLATKQGQKVLYHRVSNAVQQVCPDVDEEGFAYDTMGCEDFAWAGARPQMKRAIGLAKSGSPMTMTIAISAGYK